MFRLPPFAACGTGAANPVFSIYFVSSGGGTAEDLAMQNIQARYVNAGCMLQVYTPAKLA